ncbi:MAG: response regulator transcription factor [Lachnospiraceae bacterium]|nr:response regulator transcription factor [Lachnospiraceae bacterium]
MIRIAVVEDEKEYSDQLFSYLERFRKETHQAVSAELFCDGMSFLDEYKGDFDIVFMDIAMPHMNGLEAAKKLRQVDGIVCLIFITTLAQYAIRGYEVDALDFLVKPVTYELFRLKLEKALFYLKGKADTRNGDVLTRVTPVVTGLFAAGIGLSVLLTIKDVKPLEILPFILYLAAMLVFFDTEIDFIGNLLWATDGNSLDAGFLAVAVCGLIAVISGIVAGLKGIEEEA